MPTLNLLAPWIVPLLALILVLRWTVELVLARLNENATLARAREIPRPFTEIIDAETYDKSVRYTVAKSRFYQLESTFETTLLLTLLLTGFFPWAYHSGIRLLGDSTTAAAAVVLALTWILSLPRLPFDWTAQFRLEEQFGFNTTTPRTWWLDRLKAAILGLALGYPILWLIVSLPDFAGSAWWIYAWMALFAFQLMLAFVAPSLILPWFNRFTPLPPGSLRDRLQNLAQRTRFHHRDIFVMDGSRRSRHSNAFFTGLSRYRRIVLYDTLVSQLNEDELEAVLAHEIGHYRLGHIPRLLATSALTSFLLFLLFGQLAGQSWFFEALGFKSTGIAPLLLLTLAFGGALSFWFSPLANSWSRRFEYQADRFSARQLGSTTPLVHALRKLTLRNLGNLTPHPAYSWFYYSHPTLWERERALASSAPSETSPLARQP
jgi:STE24 endopeptidase